MKSKLIEILKKSYNGNIDEIQFDKLLGEQGVDSLDIMDFYLNVEEEFDVVLEEDTILEFDSLNDLISYLEKNK